MSEDKSRWESGIELTWTVQNSMAIGSYLVAVHSAQRPEFKEQHSTRECLHFRQLSTVRAYNSCSFTLHPRMHILDKKIDTEVQYQ